MPTKTPVPLATLIEESLLLSDERKAELLKALPTLKPNEEDTLRGLLASQESIIENIVTHAIEQAVAQNDAAFLESLDQFLHDAMKNPVLRPCTPLRLRYGAKHRACLVTRDQRVSIECLRASGLVS